LWNWLSVSIKSLCLYHVELPLINITLFGRIINLFLYFYFYRIGIYLFYFYATTVNVLMGFMPRAYSHGAYNF